jgi:hypothetical protein
MYRKAPPRELQPENFDLPFGGKLSGENRWVKLSALIPWETFEGEYAEQFSERTGAPAKPFRMALGALLIKEKLRISDEETVEQIRENPYLQYFIGLSAYSDSAPFDASMMVHFRKRLNLELIVRVNESVVTDPDSKGARAAAAGPAPAGESPNDDDDAPPPPNQGQLILDASATPADIHYPTDIGLLNAAREHTELVIDVLYEQVQDQVDKKPRTYRQQARKRFLGFAKQRRSAQKQRRKAIGQQLGYVRRNLAHIDRLISQGASLSVLSDARYKKLLVVSEVYRQQQLMYDQRVKRVDDRIVSLSQPHVRPIMRGKAGASVEFGAKITISCVAGFVRLERLDWNNFNEALDLPEQVERFKTCFGQYPESVHVDKIYRNRANIAWCKARGIRISGPPLGRPPAERKAALKRQARADEKVRVVVEGKFGQGKRRFGLARIMAKLAHTAETSIAISFLVINLERRLASLFWCLAPFWHALWQRIKSLRPDKTRLGTVFWGGLALRSIATAIPYPHSWAH